MTLLPLSIFYALLLSFSAVLDFVQDFVNFLLIQVTILFVYNYNRTLVQLVLRVQTASTLPLA